MGWRSSVPKCGKNNYADETKCAHCGSGMKRRSASETTQNTMMQFDSAEQSRRSRTSDDDDSSVPARSARARSTRATSITRDPEGIVGK